MASARHGSDFSPIHAKYFCSRKLDSEHEAQHQIMECLGQVLWQAQRDASALDIKNYLEYLQKLL
jgi:hypothetical protein